MADIVPRYVSSAVEGDVIIITINVQQIRDSTVSYALRDEIIGLIGAAQARHVIFDMRSVQFIGSVGLLAFLGVRRHLPDGRIVVSNLCETIRRLFALCRLIPTVLTAAAPFEVEATVDAALARLHEGKV